MQSISHLLDIRIAQGPMHLHLSRFFSLVSDGATHVFLPLSFPASSNQLSFQTERRHCLAPQHATRVAFAIFDDICMLGISECSQFLQLKSLHKTFSLNLIESVLVSYLELLRASSGSFHAGSPYIAVMFTAPRTLTFITTPPLQTTFQNA